MSTHLVYNSLQACTISVKYPFVDNNGHHIFAEMSLGESDFICNDRVLFFANFYRFIGSGNVIHGSDFFNILNGRTSKVRCC